MMEENRSSPISDHQTQNIIQKQMDLSAVDTLILLSEENRQVLADKIRNYTS